MRTTRTFNPKQLTFLNADVNKLRCEFRYREIPVLIYRVSYENLPSQQDDSVFFNVVTESKYARLLAELLPWYWDAVTNPFTKTIHTVHNIEYIKHNTDWLRYQAVRVTQRKLRARGSVFLYWAKYAAKSLAYTLNPWRHELIQFAGNKPISMDSSFDSTGVPLVMAL